VSVRARPIRGARGQHFLRSSRLAAELVRDAEIAPGDLVVDVGAGTGVLTRALIDAGAAVIAVELDPRLAAELRRRFAGRDLGVVEADARRWSWPREPFSVVANLPFAGSGEILGSLLRDPGGGLRQANVIVQWELAAKHAAVWPGTLRGTWWRAWFELAIVARLARSAFAPPPQVDAAVLRVTRRPRPLLPPGEHAGYRRFLSDAFRTQAPLSRALRRVLTPRELRRLAALEGFDASSHPRDLDARQWARVYAFSRSRSRSP
jgi:16S rRNA A1518/A1519 N6-dimethyltransferase RsmA/KsgA/DIM1 with predicted DNA glycosylase/AP lyase activity